MARIFIGVAWPYANGQVHVGGVAGCYLPPDIFARYNRMVGNDVLMVSGSDMHGTPVTVRAEEEGVEPAALANRFHDLNAKAFERFGVSFDLYLSTEDPTHKEVVKKIFLRLHERGYLYEKEMQLPFCPRCARTLPDRYVEGKCPHCGNEKARGDQCPECGKLLDPETLVGIRCKTCGATPEFVTRKHFFFKLSALEPQLKEWLATKSNWRPHVINFTRNFIEAGLKDRPVTRDTSWGIEIPLAGHDDKRIYVWFEAFMGYHTMAVEWARRRGTPDAWKEFWQDPECRHYYFLGKDNIPFHTIFWPAVLMAHGDLALPYDVPANAFMRLDGELFSKSGGVSIALADVIEKYNPDALRYYIASIMPENRDAEFTWSEFVAKNNNELVATLGNFVHRTLTFAEKNFGEIPKPGELTEEDRAMLRRTEETVRDVGDAIGRCEFKRGIKLVMDLAHDANRYFDSKAPWASVKTDKAACGTGLYVCIRVAKALAVTLAPFLPHGAERIWRTLGYPAPMDAKWQDALADVEAGRKLAKPEPVFRRVEMVDAKEPSPFEKLDIRIAYVLDVQPHPNADKLYVLKIGLGDEVRQIVAGLRKHYKPEEMAGRRIAVVCNLEPAKLRGVESNGMLLASEDGDVVSLLLAPADAKPGASLDGCTRGAKRLSFADFQKNQLAVGLATEKGLAIEGVPQRKEDLAPVLITDGKLHALSVNGATLGVDRSVKPGSKIK